MSRRTFFGASAISGALALVGSAFLGGGLRLDAYADEAGNVSFSVYVLSNREVPFYSFDSVTQKAIPHVPVEMSVTYNGRTQSFSFETDDSGFYAWSMDQMASYAKSIDAGGSGDSASRAAALVYDETVKRAVQMPAAITYKKKGYRAVKRDVELRCDSAPNSEGKRTNVVNLAAHPITEEEEKNLPVYLMGLSLDGVDIQYTAHEAYIHAQNDMIHTLKVEIAGPKAGVSAGASLLICDRYGDVLKSYSTVWSTTVGSDPAVATIEFKQAFLREIPVGSTLTVYFSYSSKYLYYKAPLTFVQDMSPDMSGHLGYTVSPGCQKASGTTDNRPEVSLEQAGWKLPPYDSFKIALPMAPIELFFDHKGNFGVVAKFSTNTFIKYRDGKDTSKFGEHKWFGGKSASAAFDDYLKDIDDSLKNYNSTKLNARSNNRAFGMGKITRKLDATFEVAIIGMGTINGGKHSLDDLTIKDYVWTLDAGFQVELKVDASANIPFTVWVIPFFVNFTFQASMKCQLLFGMQFLNYFENVNWHHHTPASGVPGALVVVMIDIGAEIGVGINGVAAVGVFGHGFIKAILHFEYKEGKSYPRRQAFVGCGFGAFAQALLYKKKWTLTNFPLKMIGDSWNTKTASALTALDASSMLAGSGGLDISDGEPITQQDLGNSVEYQLPSSDDAVLAWAEGAAAQAQSKEAAMLAEAGADEGVVQAAPTPLAIQLERVERGGFVARAESEEDEADSVGIQNPYGENPYNPLDGLKPTAQKKIRTGIYNGMFLRTVGAHNAFNTTDGSLDNEMPLVIGRIGTYKSRDSVATRLFLNVWNKGEEELGKEHVIEFDLEGQVTGLKSTDRLDVDFSFDTFIGQSERLGSTPHVLVLIAITSIPKSKQAASFEEQKASQFITVLVYDATYYQGKYSSGTLIVLQDCVAIKPAGAVVSHPRVLIHAHPELRSQSSATTLYKTSLSVLFYKQTTGKSDGVIAISSFDANFVPSPYGNRPDYPELKERLSALSLDIQAPVKASDLLEGTFEVSPGPSYYPVSIDGAYYSPVVIGWTGHDSTKTSTEDSTKKAPASFVASVGLAFEGTTKQKRKGLLSLPGVSSLALRDGGKSDVPFVYADQTGALNAKELALVHIASDNLALSTISGVGQTAFTNFFSDGTGDRLFTVNVIDGDSELLGEDERVMQTALDDDDLELINNGAAFYSNAYSDSLGYDNNGYQKSTESAYIHRYQIMESRFLPGEGTYCDFYPVAQLDFCPQCVAYCPQYASSDTGADSRTFLVSTTTDYDALTADLYQVTIPAKLVLHVSSARGVSTFAANGDRVWYELCVVNMGNEPITGFTAEVYGASKSGGTKKLIATDTFKQLRSYATESSDNCRCKFDASGNPVVGTGGNYETTMSAGVFDQIGVLMPGTQRTYLLYFTMASGFHGWTDFSVKAVDARSSFEDLAVESQSAMSMRALESDDSDDDEDDDYDFTDDYETAEDFEKATSQAYSDYASAYALFTKDYFVGDLSGQPEVNEWFDEVPFVDVNDDHDFDLDYDDIAASQIVDYADAAPANYYDNLEDALSDGGDDSSDSEDQEDEADGTTSDEGSTGGKTGTVARTGDSNAGGIVAAAAAAAVAAAAALALNAQSTSESGEEQASE